MSNGLIIPSWQWRSVFSLWQMFGREEKHNKTKRW